MLCQQPLTVVRTVYRSLISAEFLPGEHSKTYRKRTILVSENFSLRRSSRCFFLCYAAKKAIGITMVITMAYKGLGEITSPQKKQDYCKNKIIITKKLIRKQRIAACKFRNGFVDFFQMAVVIHMSKHIDNPFSHLIHFFFFHAAGCKRRCSDTYAARHKR